jgi:PAS domain S-box-containing protein
MLAEFPDEILPIEAAHLPAILRQFPVWVSGWHGMVAQWRTTRMVIQTVVFVALLVVAVLGWHARRMARRLARAERRLARAEIERDFLEGILDAIADPIFVKDRDHRLVWVNEAECRLAGKERQALVGKTDYDFFPKDQVDVFWRQDDVVFETGHENVNEEGITSAEGAVRAIVTKKSLWVDRSGTQHIVGVIRDISDRKRAEEEVRRLNSKLEQRVTERTAELSRAKRDLDEIIDTIADPLFVKDEQHRFVLVNRAQCDLVGLQRHELLGKSDHDLFPKSESDVFWAKDQLVLDTGAENINEEIFTNLKGVVYTLSTKRTLFIDEKGGKRIVGVIRDITERKRLDEQLRQAQKMESVGLLAGGIAHDFNNLLTPILGNCQLLLLGRLDPAAKEMVEEVERAAEHLKVLTRQLLAFGRKQMLELRRIDLRDVVTSFEPILRRTIQEDIRIELSFAPDLETVLADAGQLEQVLLNLAINARDAMPTGGVLTIEGRNVNIDEGFARAHRGFRSGRYAALALRDTGTGMDQETQQRLFEPFFSTKKGGRGSGLGLAMVHGIVEQHLGAILVHSELGKGSTFEIYLPCAPRVGGADVSGSRLPGLAIDAGKGETILVLEDDTMVRVSVCNMLRRMGYKVIEADSAEHCCRLAASHQGHIDLFLTDVVMPDMNGKEVYERLAPLRKGLKVLYMSGYAADVIVHRGIVDEEVQFIQKPLSIGALSRKIREILDSQAASQT